MLASQCSAAVDLTESAVGGLLFAMGPGGPGLASVGGLPTAGLLSPPLVAATDPLTAVILVLLFPILLLLLLDCQAAGAGDPSVTRWLASPAAVSRVATASLSGQSNSVAAAAPSRISELVLTATSGEIRRLGRPLQLLRTLVGSVRVGEGPTEDEEPPPLRLEELLCCCGAITAPPLSAMLLLQTGT